MDSVTFPPPGFELAESQVEGITVYKPAPHEENYKEIVSFKCPNCGTDRAYSAADGGLTCSACGYHEAPQVEVVGHEAEEFEFTVDTLQQYSHGWGIERKELHCQSCGAATTLPPDMISHTCPFCGSINVVQQKAPQDVMRPRYLVPLKLEDETCKGLSREWLGSSWMTPRELKDSALLDNFSAIYLPFWTFDAQTDASWRAQVGHTRTTGSGKNRRTTTVWKWESGQVQLTIDDLLISGTRRVSQVLLERAADFSMADLVPYDPTFLAGIRSHSYEILLEDAWDEGRSEMREQTKQACRNQASSNKIRNFSMSLDFSNESWRYILLPVYVSHYRYKDATYQLLVNAQTGKVAGQRPVDWLKVIVACLLALMPSVIVLIGSFLSLLLGVSQDTVEFGGILGFIIFAAGGAWAGQTLMKAMSFDDI